MLSNAINTFFPQVWFTRRRGKDRKEAEDAKLQQILAERRAAEAEGTGDAATGAAASTAGTPAANPPSTAAHASVSPAEATGVATTTPAARPSATPLPTPLPTAASQPMEDTMDDKGAYGQWLEFAALLAKARETLPQPYHDDGPRLGYEFDPVPTAAEREAHKRKRLMLDGFEAEVEDGGEVNIRKRRLDEAGTVARLVRAVDGDAEGPLLGHPLGDLGKVCGKIIMRIDTFGACLHGVGTVLCVVALCAAQEHERLAKEQLRMAERAEREAAKEDIRRAREAERLRMMEEKERARLEAKLDRLQKQEEKKREKEEKKKYGVDYAVKIQKQPVSVGNMCVTRSLLHREREVLRAMNQHQKAATRQRTRDTHGGPPDDADIEWDQLVSLRNATGYGSDTEGGAATGAEPMDIERPPFPPPWIALAPAFPADVDQASGAGLLSAWNFLNAFPEVLGMVPCSLEALLGAAVRGAASPLLAQVHIALLRLLQADIEEAHGHGVVSVSFV